MSVHYTTGTRVQIDGEALRAALAMLPSAEEITRERVARILLAGGVLVVSTEEFEALQVTRTAEPNRRRIRVYESKHLHPCQRLAVSRDRIGDFSHMPWIEI